MSNIPNARNFAVKVARLLGYAVYAGCVTHCVFEYIGSFVICFGPSMEPTIYSEEICLLEHISPQLQKINRGDIVVSKCPYDPKITICKRVKAISGDRVRHGFFSTTVPKGYVWLEGDNKGNSSDSRVFGPVPLGLVKARVLCVLWPFTNMRTLTGQQKQLA